MFANLIESASHQQDLARKGRFFLATLISYALIVACAGLASIYAYDAHLEENQDLEFLGLVPPIVPDTTTPEARHAAPRASSNTRQRDAIAQRTEAIDRIAAPTKIPETVSSDRSLVPEIPKSGVYEIGTRNLDAEFAGPPSSHTGGDGGDSTLVKIENTPPAASENTATQPKKETIKSGGVMNGQAIYLATPIYPTIGKTVRASGHVNVQILIDETGKVISARATSGHPLLLASAVRAAYQTRFSPTLLSGVPVKVSGVINYNFSLQ